MNWAVLSPRPPGFIDGPRSTVMDPRELRADIPAFEETIYLNTGASGPVPTRIRDRAHDRLYQQTSVAPGEGRIYESAFEVYQIARETIASHIGAPPETVALTESTADGIGRLAGGIEWSDTDVIVRTDTEHPAGVLPWERLNRLQSVEIRVVETTNGHVDHEAFRTAVTDAQLVCLSSVCWETGARRAVDELTDIAHDAGANVLVDAVQSIGQHPVDVTDWNVDALAGSTHKWPMGLWGGGFLYVTNAMTEGITPAQISYRGVENPSADTYTLKPGAKRFELGTSSPIPYAAADEALTLIEELGYETITSRIKQLTTQLVEQLPADRIKSPTPPESGLVAIKAPEADATVERLADAGVRIRALPDGETVRASVHVFNTPDDIDTLCNLL